MIDVVTVGWLTTDDVVLPDGSYRQRVPGGGALYSAVGARIWSEHVGIHSVTGESRIEESRKQIEHYGISARGISSIPGGGLELWLLHESGAIKQQIPRIGSATAKEMDDGRGPLPEEYLTARGFHIAPQSPESSFRNVYDLSSRTNAIITMDLLVDPYVDASKYQDMSFLDRLDAFLPSQEEVHMLWKPSDLLSWAKRKGQEHDCIVAVKRGAEGSIVSTDDGESFHIPAYPIRAVDTTGAGDAYCGGFIAGLISGKSAVESAAMGTVSASYVVEVFGALDTRLPQPEERDARLQHVLSSVN